MLSANIIYQLIRFLSTPPGGSDGLDGMDSLGMFGVEEVGDVDEGARERQGGDVVPGFREGEGPAQAPDVGHGPRRGASAPAERLFAFGPARMHEVAARIEGGEEPVEEAG